MFIFSLSIISFWIAFIPFFYLLGYIIPIIFMNIVFGENFIFFFIFFLFFALNIYYCEEKTYVDIDSELEYFDNTNFDLYYKYFITYEESFWFLFNFFKTRFKKFFFFSFFFKNDVLINSVNLFYKNKIKNRFVIWRPIFKKWSYLGYYRSNRSKWIK